MKIICKSKNHSNQEYRQEGSSITFVPFLGERKYWEMGVISVLPPSPWPDIICSAALMVSEALGLAQRVTVALCLEWHYCLLGPPVKPSWEESCPVSRGQFWVHFLCNCRVSGRVGGATTKKKISLKDGLCSSRTSAEGWLKGAISHHSSGLPQQYLGLWWALGVEAFFLLGEDSFYS